MKPGPKTQALLEKHDKVQIGMFVDKISRLIVGEYEGVVIIGLVGVLAGCVKEAEQSEDMRRVVDEILDSICAQKDGE